jgi:PleD family two-component response regulator
MLCDLCNEKITPKIPPVTSTPRVLIVDDDSSLTKAMISLLGKQSIDLVVAEPEALMIKANENLDLIQNFAIQKPKQPNFARFQNNFKRNRR